MLGKWLKEIDETTHLFIKKNGKDYQIILRFLNGNDEDSEEHLIAEGDKWYCEDLFQRLSDFSELLKIVSF